MLRLAVLLVALYLIGRAIVEPFTLDLHHHAYRSDWGGPTLAGVLAVHIGPGLLALLVLLNTWRRRQHTTS